MVRLLFWVMFLQCSFAFAAGEGAQTFTLDGRLYSDAAQTTPLLDTNVTFTFYVLDPSKDCILYAESQAVNSNASNGYFTFQVGSPNVGAASLKRIASDPSLTMATALQNASVINGKRVSTGAACAYTPTAGDGRYIRVSVNPSSGVQSTLTPDLSLDAVPTAIVAESLQGLSRTDVLSIDTSGQLSQANLSSVFSNTNYPRLTALLGGTSTQYLPSSSTGGGALPSYTTATPPSAPAAGSIWYDSTAGAVKYYNGSSTVTLGASGAGLSSLTVSSNLTADGTAGGTLSAPGTIDLNDSGVSAGTYTKVTVNAKGVVTSATNITGADITSGTIGGSTAVNTTGAITTTGTVTGATLSGTNVTARNVQYFDADTNKITIQAPTLSADYSLTLPTADGSSGQALVTDGSGTLSWASAGGGSATSVSATNGSAAAPSIAFSNDSDTGFYSSGTNTVGVTAGGTNIFNISSLGVESTTTGGGVMTQANGTAAAPTFSFSGDTDTGWFRPAADTMAASTGGSERVRIDSSGNLGIATTAPVSKLHIGGDPTASANYGSISVGGGAFDGSTAGYFTGSASGTAIAVNITNGSTANLINLQQNGSSRFLVDRWGNLTSVGGLNLSNGTAYIDPSSPIFSFLYNRTLSTALNFVNFSPTSINNSSGVLGAFTVNLPDDTTGTGGIKGIVVNKTGSGTGSGAKALMDLQVAGVSSLWAGFDSRIGIGTTTPGSALDVKGTLRLSGSTSGYVGLAPAATAGSTTYTLPSADGTSGQVLSTDGSGILSWSTASSGAAATVAASNGTVGAPSISYSGDPDTGLYSNGANTVGIAAGGSNIFNVSSAGVVSATTGGGLMTSANGTAAAPTFSFSGDPDTGWFRAAADTLAAATSGSERVRITSTGLVGIGTTSPVEQLDVNGGIRIGSSSGTNSGTIRWDGTNFQGYTGTGWVNLSGAANPGTTACDTTQSFTTSGTYVYNVPASFGTITIRVWGGGGGGGGAGTGASNGTVGGSSSIASLGLSANGGAPGMGGNSGGTGGAGGAASGGTTNTAGAGGGSAAGSNAGSGGAAPNGGNGGVGAVTFGGGASGQSPGGGGGGAAHSGSTTHGGGGGSGGYVEKTFTPATLIPGTSINDIIVGGLGNAGGGSNNGGAGGTGRVTIACSSTGTPPANDRSLLFMDGSTYSTSTSLVYTATGRVGIGTSSPTETLDVTGNIKSSGTLNVVAEQMQASVNSGTAVTLGALTSGSVYQVTLTGNATITLPSDPGVSNGMAQVTVVVTQDGTGSRTLAFAAPGGDSLLWSGGSTPTTCSTAGQKMIYQFIKINGDANWYGAQVWRQCY